MPDDPKLAYLAAFEAYDAVRVKAMAHVQVVKNIANALGDLDRFVETTIEGKKSTIQTARPLERWPDPETLRACLVEMKAAFVEMRKKWDAIPHDRRSGLSRPPERLGAATP